MEEFNFEDGFDESTGSGFADLRETGVTDVTLKRVSWNKTKNGAIQIQITVNSGGEYDDTFYQGNIKNINGDQGFEVKKLLNPLKFICGVKALTTSKETISTGNGNKEVNVFDQFTPTKIKIAHQKTWNDWNGGKWEKKIAHVFLEDGRSASEAEKGEPAKQIQWYLDETKFKDKGPKGKAVPTAKKADVPFDTEDFEDDF